MTDKQWELVRPSMEKGKQDILESLSNNLTPQKALKNKEKRLQNFVKQMPITIEYGCHTIELKEDKNLPCYMHGFTFSAVEDDGKGIRIRIN